MLISCSTKRQQPRQCGVWISAGARNLPVLQNILTGWWAHSACYSVSTWSSFSEVKWLGCEAYNSLLSSSEVKNEWSYTLPSPVCFMCVLRQFCLLTCICLIVGSLSGENVTWQRKKTWHHSDTRPCDIKLLHVMSQRNNTMRIWRRAYRNTIMLIRSRVIRDIITESQYCITWH